MIVKTVSKKRILQVTILLILIVFCCPKAAAQYSLASAFTNTADHLPSPEDTTAFTLTWDGMGGDAGSQFRVLSYESFQSFLMQFLKPENTYVITIETADGSTISAQFVMPASRPMKVLITCECADTNSVGNEWGHAFSVNGMEVTTGETMTVTANENIIIHTKITEFDEYDDIGEETTTHLVTQEDVFSGFSVEQSVAVTEHHGTYSGNTAIWTVTYTFIPQ